MENSIEFPQYLLKGTNAITVTVIGVGGTGSWVLGDLVSLHHYLQATGRPGLSVTVYDPDIVTEANLGRQNFTHADLNENKAICLVEKYNRYWGLNWIAHDTKFEPNSPFLANILISCVDSIKSRKEILNHFAQADHTKWDYKIDTDLIKPYFWIDCGNGYDYGQVIVCPVYLSLNHHFFTHFPNQKEVKDQPSCSVLESLGKQNLFINKFMANLAVNWLYEGIRNTQQTNLGYFFNFNSLTPIYI